MRGATIRYALNFASLQSRVGNTDNAFEWFSYAVKTLGFCAISGAKVDPDFAAMRRAKQREFEDLVAVKWGWGIQYGVFFDDIVLENNSAFSITNVVLTTNIVQGDKKWNHVLTIDRIAPGASHKWESVVSIPGNRVDNDKTKVTLSCDQTQ